MTFFRKFAVVSLLSMSMAHAATLPGGRYGDVAFTKPAPLEGGPFVTLPSTAGSKDREPRARPPEL